MVDDELSANKQSPESWMNEIIAFRVPLFVSTFEFSQSAGSEIFFYDGINRIPYNHSSIPANSNKDTYSAIKFD